MPTLAPPAHPIEFVGHPYERSAQGTAGILLADSADEAREKWYGHSVSLAPKPEPEDLLDNPPAVFRFPTIRTVQTTFTVVGRLQPLPLPDLDD